jgi:hypothetical protein
MEFSAKVFHKDRHRANLRVSGPGKAGVLESAMHIDRFRRRRCATALLCALAGCACGLSANAGPTLVDWLDSTNGDWFDATRWSGGVVPNNGGVNTFAARFGGVNPYTVTLNASAAISSLEFAVGATLRLGTIGDLAVVDTLALNNGTLDLRRGNVSGGVWTGAGGVVRFESGSSIENATFANSMTLLGSFGGALLDLRDVTFAHGADIRMGANNESFNLRGNVAVADGATIQAGGRLNGGSVVPTRTHLFEGATFTIESGGLLSFASPGVIAGDGTGLFRNEGTLNSGVFPPLSTHGPVESSSTMTWLAIESSAGEFQNAGLINVGASGITSIGAKFSNSGVIDVHSGTLALEGEWDNAGDINLLGAASSLVLGGVFSTESTEGISHSLGTIFLDGVMNNVGATTDLQTGNARWTARGAIIEGGTVDGRMALSQRAVVGAATLQDATLLTPSTWNLFATDNIVLERTEVVGAAFIGLDNNATLTLRESSLPDSIVTELRSNSTLIFEGADATLVDTDLRLLSGSDVTVRGAHSLTIDATSAILVGSTSGLANVSGTQGARLLENRGLIRVEPGSSGTSAAFGNGFGSFLNLGEVSNLSNGTLTLHNLTNSSEGVISAFGASGLLRFVGDMTNEGAISAIGSDVSVAGSFTNFGTLAVTEADLLLGTSSSAVLSNKGSISLTDGTLTLGGEYASDDLTNITFGGDWNAVAGGVWRNEGGSINLGSLGPRWSLEGEIRGGNIELGAPGARAAINGLTLSNATVAGTSVTLGPNEDLGFQNALLPLTLAIGASSGATVRFDDTVLVGVDLAGLATPGSAAPTLVLDGASEIGVASRVLGRWDIEGSRVVNRGLISGDTDADVSISSTGLMLNYGSIASSGALSINASTAITNWGTLAATGQITLSAPNVLLVGALNADSVSLVGTIQNQSTVDAANLSIRTNSLENDGMIRAVNGSISAGGVNRGEIVIDGGGEVDLSIRAFSVPTLTNSGSIRVVNGSTLEFVDITNQANGALVNTGTIFVDQTSTFRISRAVTSDALTGAQIEGLLDIRSTVDNAGRTLSVAGDGVVRVSGGSNGMITGGTIDLNGDTLELYGVSIGFPRGRLDGVGVIDTNIATLGDVRLSNGFYQVGGWIDMGGQLRISDPFLQSVFSDEIRLNGKHLTLENVSAIASGTRITGPGTITNLSNGVVNNLGTIEASAPGTLTFASDFANSGLIGARNGATVVFNDDLSNAGRIEASDGSLIDFTRILSNTGVIEARGGSTLDMRSIFAPGGPTDVGIVRVVDSALRWNTGFFTGDISLTRSDLRLGGSVFVSLLDRFHLDDASRLVLGDNSLATFNLENSHYDFDRDVVFAGALIRDGSFNTPRPLDGQIGLFIQNAQYVGGDIVLRGDSSFGATGNPTPNGVVRSMGDTSLHLRYTQSLAAEFVHTSGDLELYADSNSTTRLEDRFAILGGSASVTRSSFLPYVPTIINLGEFHVESSSSQPTVFLSSIGNFDNRGVISVGSGGRVEFDPRDLGVSSLVNFDIAARTLTGGRYIIGNGGRLTLRGGGIETNNAEVEIHGSGQFDALMQFIQRNNGSISILDNANVSTISSFANDHVLRIENSRLGAFILVNNSSLIGINPDLDVAYLTLAASSDIDLIITSDASQTDPFLSASLGGSVGGSLAIAIENAALFEWGDRFELLRIGGSRQGDFEAVDGPASADGLAWVTEWVGDSFFLRARDWADLDDNGVIDADDLAFVKNQYGQPGGDADIDGDGVVAFSDLNIVLSRFGASAPVRAVPTPGAATGMLLVVGVAGAGRRRRAEVNAGRK